MPVMGAAALRKKSKYFLGQDARMDLNMSFSEPHFCYRVTQDSYQNDPELQAGKHMSFHSQKEKNTVKTAEKSDN